MRAIVLTGANAAARWVVGAKGIDVGEVSGTDADVATGDLLGGVELKHQLRTTIFDGTPVAEGSADVAQLVVGWNGRWSDNLGANTLDVRFKSNPGGIMPGNNSRVWSAFTNERITDVRTNLITLEFGRVTPLPKGLSLKSEVSVLASSKPLPDTERIGIGGIHAVRLCGRLELQFQTAGRQGDDRRAAHPGRVLARVAAGARQLLRPLPRLADFMLDR